MLSANGKSFTRKKNTIENIDSFIVSVRTKRIKHEPNVDYRLGAKRNAIGNYTFLEPYQMMHLRMAKGKESKTDE